MRSEKKVADVGTAFLLQRHPCAGTASWKRLPEPIALICKKNRLLEHTSSNGTTAGQRIIRAGYQWALYGENIAMGFENEKEVVSNWLTSPGHCANIMNASFRDMGAARAGKYWTLDLGAR